MSDHAAFLRAIIDDPDEDAHRLVYADWLDDNGDPDRAQFIRLQCTAAREKPWSEEANRLWEEIGRVWNRLDEEWWPATRENWPFRHPNHALLDAAHFPRGFPRPGFPVADEHLARFMGTEIWLPWLPPADCSLALTPVGRWEQLSTLPQLRRVAKLRLDCWQIWEPDEMPDEFWNVLFTLAQRGHVNGEDVQAVVQVFAECSLLYH